MLKTKDGSEITLSQALAFLECKGITPPKLEHYYCPHYGVNSAATRRWTSAYHGIPGNGEIKGALVPRWKNGFFLHADFSQNEYRVFAALAGEEAIMQAFREGKDIHRFIASKVFNKPEKEITGAERNVAKRLSFGLLYGKGIPAIAEEYFRGDVKYAQSLFDMFFNMFPRIKAYMEEQKAMLFNKGYITTVWGDPIYLPYDASSVSSVHEAIRYAINYPTQSTASSAAALTGFELKKMARERKWELAIPGFIHDCLEGDFGHNYFLEVFDQLPQLAEEWPYEAFKLPLSLDIELGVRGGPYLVEFKRTGEDRRFVRDGVMRAKFEGRKDAVEELFERLKCEGRYNVTVTDTEEEESYGNWKELYMKVASSYSRSMGRTVTNLKGKVEVSLR